MARTRREGWDMDRRKADRLVDAIIAVVVALFWFWGFWSMILNWPIIAWVVFLILVWLYIKYIYHGLL